MKVEIHCRFPKCKNLLTAWSDDCDPWQLALLTLVSHTTYPHGNGHPIEVSVDGGEVPQGAGSGREGRQAKEFRIACVHPGCDRLGGKEAVYLIDPALSGACAIAFHAVHEGHALELWWDGCKIHPPD